MKRTVLMAAITVLLILPGTGAFADDRLGSLPGDANYPMFTIPAWSDTLGWDREESYSTIHACDLDGDGNKELIARQSDGLVSYKFNSKTGMWEDLTPGVTNEIFQAPAWSEPRRYRTIFCADVYGKGADQVIARLYNGSIVVAQFVESRTDKWHNKEYEDYFADYIIWEQPQYYQTIQHGDLDGDGRQEIIYRSPSGLRALFWVGNYTFVRSSALSAFSDENGFAVLPFYLNIHVDDIDGDGKDEIWALTSTGAVIWRYNKGNWELAAQLEVKDPDWVLPLPAYYSTWQAADFDGDGIKEIFGRTRKGIHFFIYTPPGELHYTEQHGFMNHFADGTDYEAPAFYNSIRAADTNGDGKAELWALDQGGLSNWDLIPHRGGFKLGKLHHGPRLPAKRQWNDGSKHYLETFRFAELNGDWDPELLIRGGSGIRTYSYNNESKEWHATETAFAAYSSGEEAVAYQAILEALRTSGGLLGPDTDLRASYKNQIKGNWANMALVISTMEKPEVSQEVWDAVKGQLLLELNAVPQIAAVYASHREHYTQLLELYSDKLDHCITLVDLTGTSWLNKEVPVLAGKLAKACADGAISVVGLGFTGEAKKLLWPLVKPVLTLSASALWSGIFDKEPVSSETSLKVAYGELKDKLRWWFEDNLRRNTYQYEDVVSNWSKMSLLNDFYNKVGEKYIRSLDDTLEPLTEAYSTFAYQTLMPLKYQIVYKLKWYPSFIRGDYWYDTFSYSEPPAWSWGCFSSEGSGCRDYYLIVQKGTGKFPHMAVWPAEVLMQDVLGKDLPYEKKVDFFLNTENWQFDRKDRTSDFVIR